MASDDSSEDNGSLDPQNSSLFIPSRLSAAYQKSEPAELSSRLCDGWQVPALAETRSCGAMTLANQATTWEKGIIWGRPAQLFSSISKQGSSH